MESHVKNAKCQIQKELLGLVWMCQGGQRQPEAVPPDTQPQASDLNGDGLPLLPRSSRDGGKHPSTLPSKKGLPQLLQWNGRARAKRRAPRRNATLPWQQETLKENSHSRRSSFQP